MDDYMSISRPLRKLRCHHQGIFYVSLQLTHSSVQILLNNPCQISDSSILSILGTLYRLDSNTSNTSFRPLLLHDRRILRVEDSSLVKQFDEDILDLVSVCSTLRKSDEFI